MVKLGSGLRVMAAAGALLVGACGQSEGGELADGSAWPDSDVPADGAAPEVGVDGAVGTGEGAGEAPAEVPASPREPLFGTPGVHAIDLELGPVQFQALIDAPDVARKGAATVDGERFEAVGIRLGGRHGAFRQLVDKAAFELDFGAGGEGRRLDGYRRIVLANMVRDASMMRERLGHALFRALDVPSGRTSYVWVKVNGVDYGLYLAIEPPQEAAFLEAWFGGSDGLVYEAVDGLDVRKADVAGFLPAAGDDPERAALSALAEAIDGIAETEDADARYELLSEVVDLPRFLRFAATEVVLGHHKGYVRNRSNYFLHRDAAGGRWTFVPWELDDTFSEQLDPWDGPARIFRICLGSPPCRLELGRVYEQVANALGDPTGLRAEALAVKPTILELAARDPRQEYEPDQVASRVDAVLAYLAGRPGWVLANLGCADPASMDRDGDGFSSCDADCDDDDPAVFPGAPELCNLQDDDCDGTWDEDPSCPTCLPATAPDGARYDLCFVALPWAEAQAACEAGGGNLASIADEDRQTFLAGAVFDIWWNNWWIGLSDRVEEGSWVWSDGSPVEFTAWSDGEPNNAGGNEDCVHFALWGGGRWNDLPCSRALPYICALP